MNNLLPQRPAGLDVAVRVPATDVWSLLAPAIAAVPGGPPQALLVAGALLNVMAGIEQADSLRRIDAGVARLLKAPLKAGQDNLYHALHSDTPELRQHFLLAAVDQFTHARHVEAPPDNIRATTYLAACLDCLDQQRAAADRYQEAFEAAHTRQQALVADLAKLTRQAGFYYPTAMALSGTLLAPLAYAV